MGFLGTYIHEGYGGAGLYYFPYITVAEMVRINIFFGINHPLNM